jgi:lipopolysaccharide export system permease protein
MLKKIDWYILRQFFVTFIFCMLLFTVIAVAVDSSEKADDFVRSGLSTSELISKYYVGFVPHIWGLLYPLFVFIAVIFFTSKMASRSEIIALLATGTTYNRWLRTYVIGGIFFSALLWFAARYALPKANGIRSHFEHIYIHGGVSRDDDGSLTHYKRTDSNTYIGIKYFDTTTKIGNTFFMNRIKGDALVYNLRSESIRWDTAKKGWLLVNATERKVEGNHEVITRFTELPLKLSFLPRDLRRDVYLKERINTPELIKLIELESLLGNEGVNTLMVERYRRTSVAFSVLLLTIIGAVVASRKTRGGTGVHLAVGIGIAVSFIIFDRFSTVFSTKGNLHPLIAAWIPNTVFSFVAFYLYRRAPK